jgi:hypothetical protein
MEATHFLTKMPPNVATEMALNALAHNNDDRRRKRIAGGEAGEGERICREMVEYMKLTPALITSTKAILENLSNFWSIVAGWVSGLTLNLCKSL